MKALPMPTENVVRLTEGLRSPLGLVLLTAAWAALSLGALRGKGDAHWGWITAAFLALALGSGLIFLTAIYLPMIRLRGPRRPLID
jgi:hypothetical protein